MYNKAVRKFLFPFLTKDKTVLEYGSGQSSIEIAKMVKSLVTLEHTQYWSEKIFPQLPLNASMIYCPHVNLVKGTDGTYEGFKNYIEAPKGKFDVIMIDGRARVGCAKYAKNLADENTDIFIDDYDRKEYHEAEKYLTLIDRVDNMAHFKLKCQ